MRFLTVKSGVPSRAYAVVAKETEVPAPSVAIPVTFKFPLTAKSPPTVKLALAFDTLAALNALYATPSRTSPFCAPPFNTAKVDPSEEV